MRTKQDHVKTSRCLALGTQQLFAPLKANMLPVGAEHRGDGKGRQGDKRGVDTGKRPADAGPGSRDQRRQTAEGGCRQWRSGAGSRETESPIHLDTLRASLNDRVDTPDSQRKLQAGVKSCTE